MIKKSLNLLALIAVLLMSSGVVAQQKPNAYAVSSAHELATQAGVMIFEKGGNAYDAAVAVSAALAVVEPSSSGIGGGGFWMLQSHDDSLSVMVDGREVAPAAAHRDMYLDDEGNVDRNLAINGGLAAGIPGAPAAWVHIAENYGTLPLSVLLQPAIDLAANGYPADEKYVTLLAMREEVMNRWPETAEIFMPEGEVPEVGDIIVQEDLANTLRTLVGRGHDGFYTGEIAQRLVEGTRAAGGIWTLEDLANYTVKEREPITTEYRGFELISAAPPSSGGITIAQILNLVEPYDLSELTRVERTHLLAEAMRRAYRDRALYLGDTDFVDVPMDVLLSKDYAAGMRTNLRLDQATPSSMLANDPDVRPEGNNTTHFSLIDAEGNMVSATLTVNLLYGAAYVPPGTGVLLNNEMDDFSAKPGAPNAFGLVGFEANAIEPYKRMLSSMSPTIVRSPERVAVIGTPGGSRIITMVLLGLLDFIDGHGPESWVSVPRFHHQYLPDEISIEPDSMSDAEVEALEALGHKVVERDRTWGNMHGVMWDVISNEMKAAHDPRWTSGGAVVVPVND
jgi:gamma-glutamyltranspeptidase/glutathione hydrolase